MTEGRGRKEVAAILGISLKTVEFHTAAIGRKLNPTTVADFTRRAIEHEIVAAGRHSWAGARCIFGITDP